MHCRVAGLLALLAIVAVGAAGAADNAAPGASHEPVAVPDQGPAPEGGPLWVGPGTPSSVGESHPGDACAAAESAQPQIEVEVTASHEWPAKVETVTSEDVEKMVMARFIGDVIERMPGADTLSGCLMGAHLLTIRGNNSEWTELILDGIPVSPMGRPYILNFVPMAAVDSVRILKGPVPPKYPGSTIAGLVLLEMKTGDRYPGTEVAATVGGFGERILDVNTGGGSATRNHFLSFTRNQTSGWLPHTEMSWSSASAKLVLAPDARSRLTLVGAGVLGEKNGPRPLGPNPRDKWEAEWTDVRQPKAAITYERGLGEHSEIMVRVVPTWFSGTQAWTQWFTDHAEQRFMPWEYELLRGEFQHTVRPAPERVWAWGASWQKDSYGFAGPLRLQLWDHIPASSWRTYTKRGRSLYAQHTQPAGATGTLTLGGRYDAEDPGQAVASPFASWRTRLDPATGLRLAFTRNRRFPNLIELYGQGVWVGNPHLQPEMGWTYQADLSRVFPSGILDLTLFNSDLKDLVVADDQNVFCNLNQARFRGVEASWQSQWNRGSLWANYTYLDAADTATGAPFIAAFRTAFPRHSAKAGAAVMDGRGGEHVLEVLAYGRRRTDVDQPIFVGEPWNVVVPPSMPGFVWVNYKYSRHLSAGAELTLAVKNVMGVEAQDLLFYPRPGRWASATVSWQF